MAEIGHFEWRGKYGKFSESFFSPSKANAAYVSQSDCLNSLGSGGAANPPAGSGRALVGVKGAKLPEAPDTMPFLRAQTGLEFSIC